MGHTLAEKILLAHSDADEIADNPLLDLSECFLTAFGKNGGNAFALVFDDQLIGIHEPMPGNRGETASHSGFAAAHKADEHEIR